MLGRGSMAKNYRPVNLYSVVSKIFKKFVNNSLVDYLKKCGISSDFQSTSLTADLLIVVSGRIARAFNKTRATQSVALDIFKDFNRVWHAGVLHKLKSSGVSGQAFGLFLSFFSNIWFRVLADSKSLQEHLYNTGIH